MNEEYQDMICELTEATEESIVITSTYNILFTNELALATLVVALFHIKESKHYKQEVKKETKRLEKYRKDFEKRLSEIIGPRGNFYADANQTIEDECNEHLDNIRNGMMRAFEKAGHAESELMSYIELARTITEMACVNLDYRINEMKKNGIKESSHLTYLRMTDAFKYIDRISRLTYKGNYVNLNQCEDCVSSLREMEKKLTDANLLAKAIVESNKLNPINE